MAVTLIVAAATLLMAAFVGLWVFRPRCRAWIEAPKYQPLGWDEPEEPRRAPRGDGSGT